MTVGELREVLASFPQDSVVLLEHYYDAPSSMELETPTVFSSKYAIIGTHYNGDTYWTECTKRKKDAVTTLVIT